MGKYDLETQNQLFRPPPSSPGGMGVYSMPPTVPPSSGSSVTRIPSGSVNMSSMHGVPAGMAASQYPAGSSFPLFPAVPTHVPAPSYGYAAEEYDPATNPFARKSAPSMYPAYSGQVGAPPPYPGTPGIYTTSPVRPMPSSPVQTQQAPPPQYGVYQPPTSVPSRTGSSVTALPKGRQEVSTTCNMF